MPCMKWSFRYDQHKLASWFGFGVCRVAMIDKTVYSLLHLYTCMASLISFSLQIMFLEAAMTEVEVITFDDVVNLLSNMANLLSCTTHLLLRILNILKCSPENFQDSQLR
ncbi:hypothetical protein RF11_10900 [Thelohanellus kitauei]|uniref:Uncharacterized protein n=1 Tax=Thelohanellus kitauei TaxID=669202 RepID=A0A0C2IXH0_THEKT|nr:hypothetical protein RF11_10900 [Thelohanellus kitauei]